MARNATKKKAAPKAPAGAETVEDILKRNDNSLEHDPSSNHPPPEVTFEQTLEGYELEANNWCDGDPLSSQSQADEVTKLIAAASELEKLIETTRKTEKEPHLEAGRAVDAKYNPLKERAQKIAKVAKRALTPWLEAVRAENERKAREAEAERQRKAEELRRAHEEAQRSSDMEAEDKVEEAEQAAKEAERVAREASRSKATATGGGYVAKLRKYWFVNVKEPRELLNHYLKNRPDFRDALKKLLHEFAEKDVRQANVRVLPGCSIWDEDRAV